MQIVLQAVRHSRFNLMELYFSNVAYHGDLERKAVMEQKRVLTGDNIGKQSQKSVNNYLNMKFKYEESRFEKWYLGEAP